MFKDFDRYACIGDAIQCTVGGITFTATLHHDDTPRRPDEDVSGFWPSLDPEDPGYIGPKSKATLARHMAHAREVMRAWAADEWCYVGVSITAEFHGVQLLEPYMHALWGIECNYPTKGKRNPNEYLGQVANELLNEAKADALEKLAEIVSAGAAALKGEPING